MQKKKKPQRPKPRKVWEIDPATKVHKDRTRYDRHREREELRKGFRGEEKEDEK
ncbi:hypothetical protein HQ563_07000 [bacterium]|nr:hypothetical protein [bacterium]